MSDEYPPTPTRLHALRMGYRCMVCHYEATSRDLDPLLGLLCPMCFRRVLARANVPFMQPITFAPRVPSPKDDGMPEHPLEKRPKK